MNDTEQRLRAHLLAYSADVEVRGPDLPGAVRTARYRARRRVGLATAGATAVIATVTAVSVLAATAGHGTRQVVVPTRPAADAPLPGLARIATVRVVGDLQIRSESSAQGQVWAVGYDPVTHEPAVLHAADGGTLTPVLALPGAAVQVVVTGGHALVVSQRETSGDPYTVNQVPTMRVYDATSGHLLSSRPLVAGRLAMYASAGLIPTDAGAGPLLLAVEPNEGNGGGPLQFGRVDADGSARLGRAFAQSDDLLLGQQVHGDGFGQVTVVALQDGVPRFAYVADDVASVTRLDLVTGATAEVSTDPGQRAIDIPFTGADQQVGGHILYTTARGLVAGSPTSLTPSVVSAQDDLVFLAGRVYRTTRDDGRQLEQQLDPATLAPTGPRTEVTGALVSDTSLGSVGVLRGATGDQTLTTYGPFEG
jgi:hypothetical protein